MSDATVATREQELDGTTTEYDEVSVDKDRIERLMVEIFTDHWARVTVGPFLQGAAWEIRFAAAPKVSMLDGYLTVDIGHWHFHLCVNDHRGTKSPELARQRRVARAAFFRTLAEGGAPVSWGLRLWNGRAEQMATVLFPSPYYDEQFKRLPEPQWEKTKLWEDLRARYGGPAESLTRKGEIV